MEPQRATSIPVELPPMGSMTPEQAALKSKTHWVWTPYKNINNLQAWGINSQLGYRDQRWTELKRCVPYPLSNLISSETDRAAVAEVHASGFSLGTGPSPKIETVKYAQEQAAELGQMYASEGLRVLVPLVGMDEPERALQIVQVVQPFEYAIHEMRHEFSADIVRQKVRASNLPDEDVKLAIELGRIMLNGAIDPMGSAEVKALKEYDALISSMSDKSVGQPGISEPNPFHKWICQQLGRPIPTRVDRTPGNTGNSSDSAALKVLMDRDAKREQEMAKQQQEMAELRARLETKEQQDAKPLKMERIK